MHQHGYPDLSDPKVQGGVMERKGEERLLGVRGVSMLLEEADKGTKREFSFSNTKGSVDITTFHHLPILQMQKHTSLNL